MRVLLGLSTGGMAHFELAPGVCLSIPLGTHVQFRASAGQAVSAVAVTLPPWPGEGEVVFVAGPWLATRP